MYYNIILIKKFSLHLFFTIDLPIDLSYLHIPIAVFPTYCLLSTGAQLCSLEYRLIICRVIKSNLYNKDYGDVMECGVRTGINV